MEEFQRTAGDGDMRRREAVIVFALIGIIAAGWCVGHGMLDARAWGMPMRYLQPHYSDFIGASGYLKAMAEGNFLPFGWKTIPDAGAPDVSNLNFGLTPDEVLSGFFSLLIRCCGLFPGINLGVLIGHIAAGVTFYLVARRGFGCGRPWAFVGGLAFGLAPYQFAQEPHHLNCQFIWHLPLFPVVWRWLASGADLSWRSRRLWQALAIGFVTGLQNPYYSNIFCQLVLVCAAVRAWQSRTWAPLRPATAIVGAVAVALLLSNLDTFTYRMLHAAAGGETPVIGQREYRWMDIYGFKLVDLFVPWVDHRSAALARFGLAHRQDSVLNDEEGSGYLGLLGIGCFLFLVGTSVRALVERRAQDVPLEAWWVLWIVLMFNTGGLNSIIAAFTGFTLFRTGIRYSVVILLLSLLSAARRMTAWHDQAIHRLPSDTLRIATLTATVAGPLLVLWDQVPRTPLPREAAEIAAAVDSDRAFVAAIEAAVPPGPEGKKPLVFQLPVMDGRPVPGIPSSDHGRPYLYSTRLHLSSGAAGEALAWQNRVQRQFFQGAEIDRARETIKLHEHNAGPAVEELRRKGFAAIYVNRNGYPDGGRSIRDMLEKLGYTEIIDSPAGDLMAVVLRKGG